MNLHNLRIFLKVAELEHITRASEELHLSQPAVTKTIQSLEQEVHLALIERQGRRIVLTHAGRTLRDYARRLFALERETEQALEALRDIEGGEITFAANTTAWVYLLPPIVAQFRTRYPHVKLDIDILNSRDIVAGTLDWRLDFGLVEGDVTTLPELLKIRVLAHDELMLVVGPAHPWRDLAKVPLAALGDGELLVRERGSGIREVIEHSLFHHHVQMRPLLTLTDNEAIKQMVMNGVGAAIVSSFCVQRELANGDLVQVPMSGLHLRTQVSLVQRSDKQLSRAAEAFCTLLCDLDATNGT